MVFFIWIFFFHFHYLGSFEEALLQRCLKPKFQVNGFKVLLGASGGFCPTQLTLAASTYFYELHGQSLSTPYTVSFFFFYRGLVVRMENVKGRLFVF